MRKFNKFSESFGLFARKSLVPQSFLQYSRAVRPNFSKFQEKSQKTEEIPAVFSKKRNEIETFPDLLEESEIIRAIQRVSPTIDQDFIKELQKTGEISEEKLKKLKKKLKNLPGFSLINLAKSLINLKKPQQAESLWVSLENETMKKLKTMSFSEIVAFLCYYSYANRRNREFFRLIENELYDRDWNYVHIK